MSFFEDLSRRIFYFLAYFGNPPWDSGISPPELIDFLQHHPAGKALDLGCGTGTNAIHMAQCGWKVTGIDFMPKAIWQARRKTRQMGLQIHYILGDVTHPGKLIGQFDLILDIGCYHNLSNEAKRTYRANLARWLAPAGTFLLYGFLRPDDETGFGITQADLTAFSSFMILQKRIDSSDRDRPSTWLWFISMQKDG